MIGSDQQIFNKLRDAIKSAEDPWTKSKPSEELRREHRAQINQIFRGLYLSNDQMFAATLKKPDRDGFQNFVTVCPYKRMLNEIPTLAEDAATLKADEKAEWWLIGNLPDTEDSWPDLVHNATFPRDELTQMDIEIVKKNPGEEQLNLSRRKKAKIESMPPKEWFKPLFDLFDKAVLGGEKTLVQCHAGASRSPTLLVAYIANRIPDVTIAEIIGYMRTQRLCVNPKMVKPLEDYASAIRNERVNSLACLSL